MSSMLAATNPGTATHASSTPASPSLGLGLDTQQLVSLVRACQVISPGAAASLGRSAAATAAATLRRVHARLAYDAAAVVCGLRPCFMADYAPLLPLRALMDVTTNIAALTRASLCVMSLNGVHMVGRSDVLVAHVQGLVQGRCSPQPGETHPAAPIRQPPLQQRHDSMGVGPPAHGLRSDMAGSGLSCMVQLEDALEPAGTVRPQPASASPSMTTTTTTTMTVTRAAASTAAAASGGVLRDGSVMAARHTLDSNARTPWGVRPLLLTFPPSSGPDQAGAGDGAHALSASQARKAKKRAQAAARAQASGVAGVDQGGVGGPGSGPGAVLLEGEEAEGVFQQLQPLLEALQTRVSSPPQLQQQNTSVAEGAAPAAAAAPLERTASKPIMQLGQVPMQLPPSVTHIDLGSLPGLPLQPTLQGMLLGYPAVYCLASRDEAEAAVRRLAGERLVLYRLHARCDAVGCAGDQDQDQDRDQAAAGSGCQAAGPGPVPQEQDLLTLAAFSVPALGSAGPTTTTTSTAAEAAAGGTDAEGDLPLTRRVALAAQHWAQRVAQQAANSQVQQQQQQQQQQACGTCAPVWRDVVLHGQLLEHAALVL